VELLLVTFPLVLVLLLPPLLDGAASALSLDITETATIIVAIITSIPIVANIPLFGLDSLIIEKRTLLTLYIFISSEI
jgi:uncharacterized membrane-anchored protein YitT (DUF2179 family)